MLFNSTQYAFFLVVIFVIYWAVHRRLRIAHAFLLASSYYFYSCWNVKYLGLIIFSTLLDYYVGMGLHAEQRSGRRKLLLCLSLIGNLGVLAVFKYYHFFATEMFWFFGRFSIRFSFPHINVLLPVGISFYTFQSLSYTIDLYRRKIEPCSSFIDFALFVAFFPQLVAGPIVRAKHFLPQLKTEKRYSDDLISSGIYQILRGLVKKIVFADFLGRELVDGVFADPATHGSLTLLLAVYAYAFQIYGDFSGYSDIAIGSAKMLGFELPMNFNSPYKAQNLREFWQRWHISLSTWLRDYLYIPLGGSRRGRGRTYVNLMITMVLGGLWHGAARTFVFWGLYHGILLSLTRLFQRRPGKPQMVNQSFPASVIAPFVTFHLICFGWILFRAEQFSDVPVILTRIIQSGDWSLDVAPAVLIILGLAAATHFCPPQLNKVTETIFVRLPAAAQGLIIAVAVGLFNLFGAAAHPFIYFQF